MSLPVLVVDRDAAALTRAEEQLARPRSAARRRLVGEGSVAIGQVHQCLEAEDAAGASWTSTSSA